MSENMIRAIIVKKDNLAVLQARLLNGLSEDIEFKGTNNPGQAVRALETGEVDVIVSGVLGVDWQGILKRVTTDNLIVLSSMNDTQAKVEQTGATFVLMDMDQGVHELFDAIRRKVGRE